MDNSKNLVIIEDTIINQNIKYENIKPKGTLFSDPFCKIIKAEDISTYKKYCIRIIPENNYNGEEIKNEIQFLEKICKYYYKPKLLPTYFGHIKLISAGDSQYLLFFNSMRGSFLEYLQSKENQKEALNFQEVNKIYNFLVNGLAFCQALGIIFKDFSLRSLLYDYDSENLILNFHNFENSSLFKTSNLRINSQLNDMYIPPEFLSPQIQMQSSQRKIDLFRSCSFTLGLLVLRIFNGEPIFSDDSSNYINLLENENQFQKHFNKVLTKIEKKYINSNEKSKLIYDLSSMLKYNSEERPDFVELFRKNIDLQDMEKVKAHILVSEGLMLPLLEKYENFESSSIKSDFKKKNSKDKVFELISSDKLIKITGLGAISIKQKFKDEK